VPDSTRVDRATLGWTAAGVLVTAWALMPVAWIVSLSFKPASELGSGRFLPQAPSLEHYRAVFTDPQFPAALWNSCGICAIATALSVTLGLLVAYAIIRLDFRARGFVLGGSLVVAMFPPVAIVGPLFDMWRQLGLFDTWLGLIIPYLTFTLPLSIWILAALLRDLPWDLERAARADGASRLQAMTLIMAPAAAPAVATAAILVFVFAWNDFLFALALTSTDRARTIAASIAFFTGSTQFELPIGSIAAASVIVSAPMLLLAFLCQRRIITGLTAGAVKG
jgi:multiple sugar transport system permease protein